MSGSSSSHRAVRGTLVDADIQSLVSGGELIVSGFAPGNVKQACYELRASRVFYDGFPGGVSTPKTLDPADTSGILIKPRQLVVVITEERLRLPSDILGRVLSKGQLFSLGLVPVNTYADPGFEGQLGIVLVNSSSNYLRIQPGDSIAKIEFVRLERPVANPYSGQHGFGTGIWPLRTQNILTPAEVRGDPRIGSPGVELRAAYGDDFGNVVDRVFVHGRRFAFGLIAYLTISLLLLILAVDRPARLPLVLTLVLGVVTNGFTALVTYVVTSVRRRR